MRLLNKLYDFVKTINLFNKIIQNLIKKITNNKFVNTNGQVYFLEKYFRCFAVSTCPPGQVLASPDMSKVRVLVQFWMFRIQN